MSNELAVSSSLNPEITSLRTRLADQLYLPSPDEVLRAYPDTASFVQFTGKKDFRQYEVYTQEYIAAFAKYLESRVKAISPTEPVTILEIGAGNGRLTYFLEKSLAPNHQNVRFIATDDQSWRNLGNLPVVKSDYQHALDQFKPQIVICSWMPPEKDWATAIRQTPSVKEYILIGEPYEDMTGFSRAVWGIPDESFEIGGFKRHWLPDLGRLQICQNDAPGLLYKPGQINKSETASFRRL